MIALAMFVALVVIQDHPAEVEQPFQIILERTPCFGMCPVYTVTIDGDGATTYEGRQFVRVTGRQTARITREAVRALIGEFARIDFFALKDQYTAMVSDLPTVYVTLRQGDRTKRVKDYFGAPQALRDLERHIDEAAGVRRWVRIDAATVKELVRAGWRAGGEDGRKLLRGALDHDEIDVLQALIDAGADVNEQADTGMTPLMTARSADAVRVLIEAGANVNGRTSYGGTALNMSVYRDPAVTKALLAAGAIADERGQQSALFLAACRGNAAAVAALLEAGAVADRPANDGKTPRECATTESRRPELPELADRKPPFEKDFARVITLLDGASSRKRK